MVLLRHRGTDEYSPLSPVKQQTSELNDCVFFKKRNSFRTSLVAQWLRICLPMQGTRVRALVWEDPTCHVATKLMRHNY